MSERRRTWTWAVIAAGLGVAGAGFVGIKSLGRRAASAPKILAAEAFDANSSLESLARGVSRGDGMALAVLKTRLEAAPKPGARTPTEAEQAAWIGVIHGLRDGFSRFSAYGRASAVVVTSEAMHRLAKGKSPANWPESLAPSASIFGTALADSAWEVRVSGMTEIKGLWEWSPAREPSADEAKALGSWKQSFLAPVVKRLTDSRAEARAAAVACLGALPLDNAAAPAVALLHDDEPAVRLQVLISFTDRATLLSEEAILPLLYDEDPHGLIRKTAERVLKSRGLSLDLIGLGKLVAHPRADMRASAIGFLKHRDDIDPVVWLVYLSRDAEESVRLQAAQALADRTTPEALKRLSEMSVTDTSVKVRKLAQSLLPPGESTAMDLPPLPPTRVKLKAN